MRKHTSILKKVRLVRLPRSVRHVGFGAMCTIAAFAIGLETAGNVHPFDSTQAAVEGEAIADSGRVPLKGDMDLDGELHVQDAMILLGYVDGLEIPAAEDIRLGDIDGDTRLTAKDVMRLLHALSLR